MIIPDETYKVVIVTIFAMYEYAKADSKQTQIELKEKGYNSSQIDSIIQNVDVA